MRYINGDFEKEFEEGANFIAEFVTKMFYDRLLEIDIQEFEILPKDLEETARTNMWKRVQTLLITSFEHIKASNFDYSFTVHTIMDEVKAIINDKNISRREKSDNVLTWVIFYTMTLFVKDDRLKKYRRKPHVEIDRSKDIKEQIFSNIVLGEEYSDQMCNYLGAYEAAKLLEMEYIIPIVEISVAVCLWAEIQLPMENEEKKQLPEPPDELNTEKAKKMFERAVKAGLMQPLKDKGSYQWNKSNVLLAYFCGKIYCDDRLEQETLTKEWVVKRGEIFFPETALNSFFLNGEGQNIKNLGQSRLQMQRPPKGYRDIDNLFDEAAY
ncbi:hypothetical protein [Parabacteroides goldsteinii]|uniref:hypothetical protein n=1 Tax=Parabacteroides goldsteinii TaxID=328812 RepID=UPI00189A7D7C|nr:hypothetical protein [Parabacteroides goldsteinii]